MPLTDSDFQTAQSFRTSASRIGELTPEQRILQAKIQESDRLNVEYKRALEGDYQTSQYGEIDPTMGRIGQFASSIGRGAIQATGMAVEGIGHAANIATNWMLPDEGRIGQAKRSVTSPLVGMGESIQKSAEGIDINPAYQEELLTSKVGQGIGSTLPFLATSALSFLGKGAGMLATTGAGMSVAGVSQQQDMEQTLGRELTPQEEQSAFIHGAPAGALEALPISRAFGRATGGSTVTTVGAKLKEIGYAGMKGALEEGAQEGIQTLAQNYVARETLGYDPDRELLNSMDEAMTVGGVTGFLMSAVAASLGVKVRRNQQVDQSAAQDTTTEPGVVLDKESEDSVSEQMEQMDMFGEDQPTATPGTTFDRYGQGQLFPETGEAAKIEEVPRAQRDLFERFNITDPQEQMDLFTDLVQRKNIAISDIEGELLQAIRNPLAQGKSPRDIIMGSVEREPAIEQDNVNLLGPIQKRLFRDIPPESITDVPDNQLQLVPPTQQKLLTSYGITEPGDQLELFKGLSNMAVGTATKDMVDNLQSISDKYGISPSQLELDFNKSPNINKDVVTTKVGSLTDKEQKSYDRLVAKQDLLLEEGRDLSEAEYELLHKYESKLGVFDRAEKAETVPATQAEIDKLAEEGRKGGAIPILDTVDAVEEGSLKYGKISKTPTEPSEAAASEIEAEGLKYRQAVLELKDTERDVPGDNLITRKSSKSEGLTTRQRAAYARIQSLVDEGKPLSKRDQALLDTYGRKLGNVIDITPLSEAELELRIEEARGKPEDTDVDLMLDAENIRAYQQSGVKPKTMSNADRLKAERFMKHFNARRGAGGPNVSLIFGDTVNVDPWITSKRDQWRRDGREDLIYGTTGMVDVEGKNVAILADNIDSYDKFKRAVWHEVAGHYSMEQLFGSKFDTFLDRVASSKIGDQDLKGIADLYRLDLSNPDDKRRAVGELIASQAENPTRPNFLKRVIGWVRHNLRTLGLDLDVSDSDIQYYISKSIRRASPSVAAMTDDQFLDMVKDATPGKTISIETPKNVDSMVNAARISQTMYDSKEIFKSRIIDNATTVGDQLRNKYATLRNTFEDKWGGKTIDAVSDSAVGRHYGPLKGLADKTAYRAIKQHVKGDIHRFNSFADYLYKSFKDLNDKDKNALFSYMKDKDADINTLPEYLRESAASAKEQISLLGQVLVDKGALNENTYNENKGGYLPRKYLMYLMEDSKASSKLGSGSRPSQMDYIKRIDKDLPPEIRERLGEMTDPSILIPHTIATIGRDISILNGMEAMSTYSNKMKPGSAWMLPGQPVTMMDTLHGEPTEITLDPMSALEYLRHEVETRGKVAKDKQAVRSDIEDREVKIRDAIAKAWGESYRDIDPTKYTKVPDDKRTGAFGGRWIDKAIQKDLMDYMIAIEPEDPSTYHKVIKGAESFNKFWKSTKTVLNPPTHVSNAIGNFALLDIATDTPTHTLAKNVMKDMRTVAQYLSKGIPLKDIGYAWRIAENLGITETTYGSQETTNRMKEYERAMSVEESDTFLRYLGNSKPAKYMKQHLPQFSNNFVKAFDKMGEYYQLSETVFKVQILKDQIAKWEQKTGLNFEKFEQDPANYDQANGLKSSWVTMANSAILDYSEVPSSVKGLRNAPIGAPFISFSYLVLPKLLENFARHPVKSMKYLGMPYLMANAFASMGLLGEEDDWDKIHAQMPEYLRTKDFVIPIPTAFMGAEGKPAVVDISKFLPWSSFYNGAKGMYREFTGDAPSTPGGIPGTMVKGVGESFGILSGYAPSLITGILTNTDAFTKKPIANEYDSPMAQTWDWMGYLYNMAIPPMLSGYGTAGKLSDMITGEDIDPATGEPRRGIGAVAATAVGLNIAEPDLELSKGRNINFLRSEIRKQETERDKAIKKALAQGKTGEDIVSIRKKYASLISERRERLREYVKETA